MTDIEIINIILHGNQDKFRMLVEKYQSMVFRTCIGFLHDKDDADDLTQEVFIQIYQSLNSFKGDAAFSTWVYRITINASLNMVRKNSRTPILNRIGSLFDSGKEKEKSPPAYYNEDPESILIRHEKSKWMIWAIAILVVMNLTTLITVMYNKSKLSDTRPVSIPNLSMTESSSMKYSGRYFRDVLDLSMEQMKKFSEFNPEFRQKVMAINRDMAEKRHNMLIEMAKKDCDTIRLNALSDSIGYMHATLKKSTYKYYLNFKNICNQQQQKKLEQLFGEMFNNDIQMGHNGRGAQGGKRFGWRNNN